jgi:hypothetical protein
MAGGSEEETLGRRGAGLPVIVVIVCVFGMELMLREPWRKVCSPPTKTLAERRGASAHADIVIQIVLSVQKVHTYIQIPSDQFSGLRSNHPISFLYVVPGHVRT